MLMYRPAVKENTFQHGKMLKIYLTGQKFINTAKNYIPLVEKTYVRDIIGIVYIWRTQGCC